MAEQNELQLVGGKFSAENLDSGTYTITLEEDGVLNISGVSWEEAYFELSGYGDFYDAYIVSGALGDFVKSFTLRAGAYDILIGDCDSIDDVNINFEARELMDPDEYEEYEESYEIGEISNSVTIKANLDNSLDKDYYSFTTSSSGYITITIDIPESCSAFYCVTGSPYRVGYFDNSWGGSNSKSFTFNTEDFNNSVYKIDDLVIYDTETFMPTATEYSLTISTSDTCPADYMENNDSVGAARKITLLDDDWIYTYLKNLTIHNESDIDYYKFTLENAADITIEALDELYNADLEMYLLDAQGYEIAYNDNFDSLNPYMEKELDQGVYYIKVTGKGKVVTDYSVHIEGNYISGGTPDTPVDPDLPGWFDEAITIEFDPRDYAYSNELYAEGYLEDTVGYYKFTLDKESFISTPGWGNIDTIIFDAKGNELKLNQNGYYDLAKGTYYVAAEGDEGWFGFIGLNKVDRYENNNSRANAAEIKFENVFTDFYFEKVATIYSAGDVDYYKFTLKDTADIGIVVNGFFDEDADTALYLLNSKGEEISYNDDYVNEYGDRWLFSLIEAENLAAGDYYIKVTGKDAVIPGYRLYIEGEYTAPAVEPVVGVSPDLYTDTEGYITSEVTITVGEQSFANPVWVEDCEGISIYAPRETFSYQEKSLLEGAPETGVTGTVDVQTEEKSVLMQAEADNRIDLFIATAQGTWESGYVARHAGSVEGGWKGTGETVQIAGKNKYTDFFWGAGDDSNLFLSDSSNGDAFFADDIYSANPGSICDGQSRFHRINTIFAGDGDDVIDLTSDDMNVISDGCTVYGGDGNDVIWANTRSALFGDAGNDSIVGSWDGDWIIGGTGNDTMHGGGGYDVFFFADGAGVDTIYQLEGGEVELVFAEGTDVEQNGNVFTYGDGCKVTVTGIDADSIYWDYSNSGMGGDISTTIFKKEDTPVEINLA